MDAGGRATHGAVAEDVRQVFAPAKPAFPPSLAVVCRGRREAQDAYRDVGGRVESGTETERRAQDH